MPSSKTCVCSLRNPRVKTEVSWPGCSGLNNREPGTSRKGIATRSICFCSKSSDVITLALAGDWSSGMSKRVAVTTIGSASISPATESAMAPERSQMLGASVLRTREGASSERLSKHAKNKWTILHNKLPPTLRESDLLGRDRSSA